MCSSGSKPNSARLPPSVKQARCAGVISLYQHDGMLGRPGTAYYDFLSQSYQPLEPREGILSLADVKRSSGVIQQNAGASLVDLGDGVLCVEFHSKMNSLGEDIFAMMQAGLEETEKNFDAMVIANEGADFSVGANLVMVLLAAQEGEWDELNIAIHRFQQVNMALKYAAKPVVVAPFARTLGGGCEITLHAARAQASAETYIGLVEVGVGLIPGGGGCKELLVRLKDPRKVFELIGYAKVSASAEDAKKLGLLNRTDSISMNPERLIGDAKALALSLVPGLFARRAAYGHQSGGREWHCAPETWSMDGAARPLHQRSRRFDRRKAGEHPFRRPADRRTDGLGAIFAGPGTRSFPKLVWKSENTGEDGVYAEDREGAEELKKQNPEARMQNAEGGIW